MFLVMSNSRIAVNEHYQHKYEFIDDPFNIIHQKLIQPICSAFDKLEKVLNSNNSCVLTFYFYNREQDDPYWSYIVNFNE